MRKALLVLIIFVTMGLLATPVQTQPKSNALLLGHQESVSDILSLITGNGGFSKGSKTLHLDTMLSDGIKLGSQIQWDPVK
jgi:hypothetical protein